MESGKKFLLGGGEEVVHSLIQWHTQMDERSLSLFNRREKLFCDGFWLHLGSMIAMESFFLQPFCGCLKVMQWGG